MRAAPAPRRLPDGIGSVKRSLKPRARAACAVALVGLGVSGPRAATAGPLDDALAAPALRGAQVAALVVRARDGATVFARDPERALAPASNLKIMTALAALDALGPAHRFVTTVRGAIDAEGRVAELGLVGGGDPALTTSDYAGLAAEIRRAGVRAVGALVADGGAFGPERAHPSWGALTTHAYHAPVVALSANFGAFTVRVQPGARAGDPAPVTVEPSVGRLPLVQRTVTSARGAPLRIEIERLRAADAEPVVVAGSIAVDAAPYEERVSVADGPAYAGSVLAHALAAQGVAVEGPVRSGRADPAAPLLAAYEGPSLAEALRPLLVWSSNPVAEALARAVALATGAPPGFAGAADATRRRLAALGLDLRGTRWVDASGLSPEDRLSPRALVDALRAARESFERGAALVAALPLAGLEGTLQHRLADVSGRVRAKSGRIERVIALSGYARAVDGDVLVFSILVNAVKAPQEEARRAVDEFTTRLVEGGAG